MSGENGIEIDPTQLAQWMTGERRAEVIDVRESYERQAGHIADTKHIAMNELSSAAEMLPRDRPVVFYCRVGSRSLMAAQAFRAAGFDAYTMAGGLMRWAAEGHPLSPQDGYVAEHS
jgi:hydroxyacylglutathione hydrolase/adenylyltransferase/sulfurtransferase